jgi:hypothetical protein
MTSEKQIQANRKNAVSHGLLSNEVLLPGEDKNKLFGLRRKVMAELQPVGELETIIVERIIASTWRLKRTLRSEKKYSHPAAELSERSDFIAGGDYRYSAWQNYSCYEASIERQLYKAMHELERLQTARLARSEEAADD